MLIITGSIGGAPFYEQDDLRNPTKGKIRSNCYITQKQIHFFPLYIHKGKHQTVENSKVP